MKCAACVINETIREQDIIFVAEGRSWCLPHYNKYIDYTYKDTDKYGREIRHYNHPLNDEG